MDVQTRSRIMRAVPQKNTSAEMRVRRCAHRLGLRYRIHQKKLPGTPDLVFPKYRIVIFVHGCFWHRHVGCKLATTPTANSAFWKKKFGDNIKRDARKSSELERAGWRVFVVWECETKDEWQLVKILSRIFELPTRQEHSSHV